MNEVLFRIKRFLGVLLSAFLSFELFEIKKKHMSLLKGCLSESCPPDLSGIAQLAERWQLKLKVHVSNSGLETFSNSWKIKVHID